MSKLVVTGCGRSGTHWIADVLRKLGLRCGHEQAFTPSGFSPHVWQGLDAEVSWLAAPMLDALHGQDVQVVHQLRHPLAVIASLHAGNFGRAGSNHQRFAFAFAGEYHDRPLLAWQTRYWIRWNRLVEEHAADAGLPMLRWRIEEVTPAMIGGLLSQLGVRPLPVIDAIDAAVSAVDPAAHSLGLAPLTLQDIPQQDRKGLREAAASYGYTL